MLFAHFFDLVEGHKKIQKLGFEVKWAIKDADILDAEILILPGVGAFAAYIKQLKKS